MGAGGGKGGVSPLLGAAAEVAEQRQALGEGGAAAERGHQAVGEGQGGVTRKTQDPPFAHPHPPPRGVPVPGGGGEAPQDGGGAGGADPPQLQQLPREHVTHGLRLGEGR